MRDKINPRTHKSTASSLCYDVLNIRARQRAVGLPVCPVAVQALASITAVAPASLCARVMSICDGMETMVKHWRQARHAHYAMAQGCTSLGRRQSKKTKRPSVVQKNEETVSRKKLYIIYCLSIIDLSLTLNVYTSISVDRL